MQQVQFGAVQNTQEEEEVQEEEEKEKEEKKEKKKKIDRDNCCLLCWTQHENRVSISFVIGLRTLSKAGFKVHGQGKLSVGHGDSAVQKIKIKKLIKK